MHCLSLGAGDSRSPIDGRAGASLAPSPRIMIIVMYMSRDRDPANAGPGHVREYPGE